MEPTLKLIHADVRDGLAQLAQLDKRVVHCAREPKPYWNRDWLFNEYVTRGRSANEIAAEHGCKENNILYFLHKHNIPVRSISEARAKKRWALRGEVNGMYGKKGDKHPNWRGGITPERQALYSSPEWADAVKKVYWRDKALCRHCGAPKTIDAPFHIHHIQGFSCIDRRADPANLILLCVPCHNWVHSRENTEREWIEDDS